LRKIRNPKFEIRTTGFRISDFGFEISDLGAAMIQRYHYRPKGFTVIELLVAMALIVLIMAVLSEAFVAGLSAFRSLKAIGDMQERMRLGASRLKQDLSLRHFEEDRRLSDIDPLWQTPFFGNGDQVTRNVGGRPQQGFLRIQTPRNPNNPILTTSLLLEGVDPDGIPSWLTDPSMVLPAAPGMPSGPILHFTSKLVPERKDALRRDQIFSTPVPPSVAGNPLTATGASLIDQVEGPPDFRQPGLMNSPWAEIAWFLVPIGESTGGTGTTQIYSLYRRQRLLIAPRRDSFYATSPTATPPGGGVAWTGLGQYYGVSCEPDPSQNLLLWNSEYSVAEQPYVGRAVSRSMNYQPQNPPGTPSVLTNLAQWVSSPVRVGEPINNGFPMGVNPENAALLGDDLVTTDVISFEIKVLRPHDSDFRDLNDFFTDGGGNQVQPYGGVYDTATAPQGWLSLRAIKVVIRVWDFKTQQSRQISIIQDL
jgi:prepilin-type N-terminal cleavage/methylation domain-containing protein